MHVLWRASLLFGRVTIPVGLATAQQRNDVSFRTLHRDCGLPLSQVRKCPEHGEVDAEQVVSGWETAPGQFVVVDGADLAAVAPEASRTISILRFVPAGDVDSLYIDRGYLLAPAAEPIGKRPYKLLAQALEQSGRAAVGTFVLWHRQNLCLIRALEGTLVLQTLFWAEDVRPASEVVEMLAGAEIEPAELDLASQLVEKLEAPFDLAAFENTHRANVRALLEGKLAAGAIVSAQDAVPAPPVSSDLIQSLKESVKQARKPARRRRRPVSATRT